MVAYSYNHRSARARNARWAARWEKKAAIAELSVIAVLSAISLLLLIMHNPIGFSSLGLDLLALIVYVWQRDDIGHLVSLPAALNTQTVRLELVLESRLLSRLRPEILAPELWQAALQQWEGVFVVQRLGIPYAVVTDVLKQQAVPLDTLWQKILELTKASELPEIDSGVVVTATLLSVPLLTNLLSHLKLKPEDVMSVFHWQQRSKRALQALNEVPNFGGIGRDWASGYTPLLNRFATNISQEVEHGFYRHVPTVHQAVIDQLAGHLNQNRPSVLVGGVGSGRTSIVYALAERMLLNDRVGRLQYYQVMSLNSSMLISAGGQIETIVMRLLGEAVQARNTIIFLDEANLFFNTGPGAVDLSQILLPILQRNVVKLVCAMTDHDWQQLVAKQPALAGILQRLVVPEPNPEETVRVVQDAAIGIEHKADTIILQPAITEAIRLAGRYLPEMAFPGKAVTVLESATHYQEGGAVGAASVQQAIQATTGAKVVAASQPERTQLLDLENQIHQRMINQVHAVKVVADALRRARAGVGSPKRPVGSFLFLGPTGVGKTELAKALAAIYFSGEDSIVRLDMTEYQQPSDLSRLLAPSTTKQQGVTLASGVRQQPSSVVLLDEIEKAHPDILNLLLQVLDEGRLTDTDGRQVSFKDAIVIATSNAAADEIRSRITAGEELEAFEPKIVDQLIATHAFKPELLNRFDEIVLFRPLNKPELRRVVELMLRDVNATLQAQQVTVNLTAAAADWLVDHGYDPTLGARPLRR
ncbi:MAG TPA: AAA family ATPase, partial [Candidatus Saccharimonadales bacterium]|nr:AAA family ATPase [Candidatus Saccharimonadales bacterium]